MSEKKSFVQEGLEGAIKVLVAFGLTALICALCYGGCPLL